MRRCASGRSWPPDDMTDLQFGLLLIGAVAVAAVLIYNRLQERAAGRRAERTFGSRHADALLGETGARREPAAAPRKNAMQSGALPVVGAAIAEIEAGEQAFQVTPREDGITLTLDVVRTPEPTRSFQAMARSARQLAAAHGARLVDDNGNPVDERALAAIGTEVEAVRHMLVELGIEPGSPLALRLFS